MSRKSSRRGSREARFGRGLKTALAVFAVVVCMFIGGSTFFIGHGSHVSADSGPARESAPAAESAQPDDKSGGEDAAGGELSGGDETAEDARPSPTPNDCDMLVPESEAVDDSYFDDAVFIGSSRTEGLKKFSGLSNSTFITEVGLTVSSIFTDYCDISGGYRSRAFDALAGMSFSKVYIMLGMNELGWVYESVFKDDYGKIIDKIREINPDAVIYIQSIIPVSKWKDSSNDVFTNANVERLNAQLRDLADEKEVHYLDVAGALMDSEGYLPYEATGDGVHLEPPYCVKWTDYLRTHTAQ